jgi:MFS family permease
MTPPLPLYKQGGFPVRFLLTRLRASYRTFHPTIWLLTWGRLINAVIMFMAFPFLAMYLEDRGVDMAVIGLVMALGPLGSALGNLVGGQLADRWGRKPMLVLGMAVGGLATAGFAFATATWQFVLLFIGQGFFGALSGPAYSAAITDLAPPEKRNAAFALSRTTHNVGAAVGPLLGALVTYRAPMFAITGLADLAFALVFLFLGVESLPESVKAELKKAKDKVAARLQARKEWRAVLSDKALLFFTLAGLVSTVAYSQMYSTYSLFVKDFAVNPEQVYARALSLNGWMVVLGQMRLTHLIRSWSAGRILVVGSLIYAFSYAFLGYPGDLWYILVGVFIWTIGEMVISPAQMTFVADIAPEELRGRYMGFSSISWTVGSFIAAPIGTWLLKHYGGTVMMLTMSAIALVSVVLYRSAAVWGARRARERVAAQAATAPTATDCPTLTD